MKLVLAFLRLIRSLNLLFIILTQCLFQYCIVLPLFEVMDAEPVLSPLYFFLLVLSSVLIAGAGYIINDYFDLNIDRINKPDKLVVEKIIHRRWAILWHWILSGLGILIGFYLGWKLGVFWLGFANAGCVLALWFYSTSFKKRLLTGNLLISLLTAWVVMVVGFITHYKLMFNPTPFQLTESSKLLRFTFLYAGFAFIISLVREVVKDIEDMEGDQKYGCRTMPILWGIRVSKVFAGTWMVVLIAAVIIVVAYVLQFGWWLSALYCLALIAAPLILYLLKLKQANTNADFHKVSNGLKLVMFTGILSMIFFLFY